MKKLIITSIIAALVALGTTAMAQNNSEEYLGLPGDNLNLYAVMKLFQESETLEGFERNLNDEKSRINNLDLNGDNYIDYITVNDYIDEDDHTIVLRVALDRKEFQDIAVFTVQKFYNGSVHIQLIGDEALYGKNYIIEPIYEETPNPGYTGRPVENSVGISAYEVAYWPVVRYIYMPDYRLWRSSWYWGYYPSWWQPWTPYYWHYYYGYHYNWYDYYYGHYHHWDNYRYTRYNDFYYSSIRNTSPKVVVNINRGTYRNTYSRPEQRSEGEALYSRVNPGRSTRTMEKNGAERSQSAGNRQSEGSIRQEPSRPSSGQKVNAPERTNPSASGRSEYKPAQSQSNGNAKPERQNPSASGRSEYKPAQSQSNGNAKPERQNPSASGRSEYKPAQSQGNDNARSSKSTPSASGRSDSKPTQSQSSGNARSSKPSNQSSGSSTGRSSQQSKSSSSSKSGSKDKESGSRRK